MSEEKPTLADVLFKNRKLVLAMLGVPVMGMVIAAGLIIYKQSSNMIVALGVILFVAIQYIMTMFFWMKRVEKLVKEKNPEKKVGSESMPVEPINVDPDSVLAPEEKRVFPIDDE